MYRLNNFDFLRLVAALAVLISHIPPLHGRSYGLSTLGAFGVFTFFAISGYLVSASWERDPSLYRFVTRRALRIVPALLAAVGISALIVGPLATRLTTSDYFEHPHFWSYVRSVFLYPVTFSLPAVFEKNPLPHVVNGSLYTLPIEVFMYGLLLVANATIARLTHMRVPVYAALLVACYGLELHHVEGLFLTMPLAELVRCASCFFAGCLMWHVRLRTHTLGWLWLPAIVLLAFARNTAIEIWALLWVVPICAVAFATASYAVVRRFGRWGDISYGLYIYAFPIQQSLMHWWPDLGLWSFSLLSVGLSMLAGIASWHLLEHPVLRLKDRLASRQVATTLAPSVSAP